MSHGWATYLGNNPNKLPRSCLRKLKELYDIGKSNKKLKVNAERAHQILVDTLIFDRWDHQLDLTVPKIKAFFSLTGRKMDEAITALEIPFDDVDAVSRRLVECERHATALSLLDEDCSEMAGGIDS